MKGASQAAKVPVKPVPGAAVAGAAFTLGQGSEAGLVPETLPPPRLTRRLKLWELDEAWHCSVVGTCLTLGELRALARKMGLRFTHANPTDHEYHGAFVREARSNGRMGKAMHRLLERKYHAVVARFGKAETPADIAALWAAHKEKGEIAGPYWAVMTHARADDAVLGKVFGEVHMLSHLVGASNRADLARLVSLERQQATLQEDLAAARQARRRESRAAEETISELALRLAETKAQVRRLGGVEARLQELESGVEVARLRHEVAELTKRLDKSEQTRIVLEKRLAQRESRLAELGADRAEMARTLSRLDPPSPPVATEGRGCPAVEAGASCDGGAVDLYGRCVLYVGGKPQQACRFREVVERHGGAFLHHDGGLEDSADRLRAALGRADAVLFPTDCVSHEACDHIKRLCKQGAKPYVPLRSSGLAVFTRALRRLAAQRATAP